MGNKKRLSNISRHAVRCTQEANILCCSITDCCSISSFKCLGMLKPLKKLQSIPYFVSILGRIGGREIPDDLMGKLEAFSCALYGNPRTTSVNELHYMKLIHLWDSAASTLEASKSIYFTILPPCHR